MARLSHFLIEGNLLYSIFRKEPIPLWKAGPPAASKESMTSFELIELSIDGMHFVT